MNAGLWWVDIKVWVYWWYYVFQIDVVSGVSFLRGVFKSYCSDFMENKASITGNSFSILRVSDVGNDSVHLRSVWTWRNTDRKTFITRNSPFYEGCKLIWLNQCPADCCDSLLIHPSLHELKQERPKSILITKKRKKKLMGLKYLSELGHVLIGRALTVRVVGFFSPTFSVFGLINW